MTFQSNLTQEHAILWSRGYNGDTQLKIKFLGACGEVTGSKYLVQAGISGETVRFLVDYGMFQGGHDAFDKNLASLPLSPASIDFIVLTHAHIDHSGLLPRLCAQGFSGPIFCTPATEALLKILLLDSAHIQQADYERVLRKQKMGRWKGDLHEPLYSVKDASLCLEKIQTFPYLDRFSPRQGIEIAFHNAGHILGAAIACIWIARDDKSPQKLVFSGDLGMFNQPLMQAPDLIEDADILIVESTYGNRLHKDMASTEAELVDVITTTFKRGGNVVIPSFAVGRAQEIIFVLSELTRKGRLPHLSIWVDSPMASAVTKLTERFKNELDKVAQSSLVWQRNHPDLIDLHFVADVEESKSLNRIKGGAIIVSASGMCEAGRIVHHLRNNLPYANNAIIITGFQAIGTLGRRLVDGATSVKIMGDEVAVNASVHTIGGLSAHADMANLLSWLKGFRSAPRTIFVVHGEAQVASGFVQTIQTELGWTDVRLGEKDSDFVFE